MRTETRAWVGDWLQDHPVVFDSERIRAAFIRAVVRDSGGIPAAVHGMLDLALIEHTTDRYGRIVGEVIQGVLDKYTKEETLPQGTVLTTTGADRYRRIYHAGFYHPEECLS